MDLFPGDRQGTAGAVSITPGQLLKHEAELLSDHADAGRARPHDVV